MPITFTSVKLPHGWLGNMAPYPVKYDGKSWKTTEHLFQALRFADNDSHEKIRAEHSPLVAKWIAKGIAKREPEKRIVVPMSEQDLANMEMVLRLKLEQHPELKRQLLDTGHETIIEDSGKRKGSKFWSAVFKDGKWVGKNTLGRMWMKLREELKGRFRSGKKVVPPSSSDDALKTILKVKSWAAEIGGMKKLKELVEALSE